MKKLSLILAVFITGCATTDSLTSANQSSTNLGQVINSSVRSISNGLLNTSSAPKMDSQGWIVTYKVPKNAPEYHIDINKPSIKKIGNKVEYKTRTVYLTPKRIGDDVFNRLKNTSYQFSPGDYIASDVIIDCNNKTYATLNHVFYKKNDQPLMRCPWKDKNNVKMQDARSGSIIENTIKSACKSSL